MFDRSLFSINDIVYVKKQSFSRLLITALKSSVFIQALCLRG